MSKPKVDEALNNIEMVYKDIVDIANDMLDTMFIPINALVAEVNSKINTYTVEEIRNYIMRIQLRAYEISETKEKSTLKAELAESLRKEKYANAFNEAQGTSGAKDNTALLATSEETVVESLYNLVANLLKTKLDQLHRLVDCLKSILMSKMQEAKLSMNSLE